ncbi:MAG: hypothetical protein WCY80_01705 [Candidatus Izemoplasmatales bacterium]
MNDIIVKNITRIIIPFVQAYGIFVILMGIYLLVAVLLVGQLSVRL